MAEPIGTVRKKYINKKKTHGPFKVDRKRWEQERPF
jgi:hypothetical protein